MLLHIRFSEQVRLHINTQICDLCILDYQTDKRGNYHQLVYINVLNYRFVKELSSKAGPVLLSNHSLAMSQKIVLGQHILYCVYRLKNEVTLIDTKKSWAFFQNIVQVGF